MLQILGSLHSCVFEGADLGASMALSSPLGNSLRKLVQSLGAKPYFCSQIRQGLAAYHDILMSATDNVRHKCLIQRFPDDLCSIKVEIAGINTPLLLKDVIFADETKNVRSYFTSNLIKE